MQLCLIILHQLYAKVNIILTFSMIFYYAFLRKILLNGHNMHIVYTVPRQSIDNAPTATRRTQTILMAITSIAPPQPQAKDNFSLLRARLPPSGLTNYANIIYRRTLLIKNFCRVSHRQIFCTTFCKIFANNL